MKDTSDCFSFKPLNKFFRRYLFMEIQIIDASKATQSDDIPTKTIKNYFDMLSNFFQENFNKAIETNSFINDAGTFPEQLKHVDMKPVLTD